MLSLTDPLWEKLDAAVRGKDHPKLLSELADAWDNDKAVSLFWDDLCHQGTCYGTTYAAVPHLLRIAEVDRNLQQRFEIALFLGHVALRALEPDQSLPLQGLPETLDGWDEKLDGYRKLVAMYEDPSRPSSAYEQSQLPRYKAILAIEPVNADDLEKIKSIRVEFLSALPRTSALCERALLESLERDTGAEPYLLSGIAAAEGLLSLARLLDFGTEGNLKCSTCEWGYEYMLFGDRIAIYADPTPEPPRTYNDRKMRDYEDEAPSRADGFIVPVRDGDISEARAARLIALAKRAPSPEPGLLLRNFLGRIQCGQCGAHSTIGAGL